MNYFIVTWAYTLDAPNGIKSRESFSNENAPYEFMERVCIPIFHHCYLSGPYNAYSFWFVLLFLCQEFWKLHCDEKKIETKTSISFVDNNCRRFYNENWSMWRAWVQILQCGGNCIYLRAHRKPVVDFVQPVHLKFSPYFHILQKKIGEVQKWENLCPTHRGMTTAWRSSAKRFF